MIENCMCIYHEACFSDVAIAEEADLQRQHVGIHLHIRAHRRMSRIHLGDVPGHRGVWSTLVGLKLPVPTIRGGTREEVATHGVEEAANKASPLGFEMDQSVADLSHGH